MLNVKELYSRFYADPLPSEHIEYEGKQILAYTTKLFVICLEQHQDPFKWLNIDCDGIVFETASGYLAIMVLFDSEQDETEKAYQLCNQLIEAKQ